MPAAITAAPSNIAVSSSVGEANLEVRRSKFDVLEAILRASGGHHGDIWEVWGAILGILQAMSAEFGFEARISEVFADFLTSFGSDCGGLEAPISDLGRYFVGYWCPSRGGVGGSGGDFAA